MLYGTFRAGADSALARPALTATAAKALLLVFFLWGVGVLETSSVPLRLPDLVASTRLPSSSHHDVERAFHVNGWTMASSSYFYLSPATIDDNAIWKSHSGLDVALAPLVPPTCLASVDLDVAMVFVDGPELPHITQPAVAVAHLVADVHANCAIVARAYDLGYTGVIFHTPAETSSFDICPAIAAALDITPGAPFVKGAPRLSLGATRARHRVPAYISLVDTAALVSLRSSHHDGTLHLHRTCDVQVETAPTLTGHLSSPKIGSAAVALGAYFDGASHAELVATVAGTLRARMQAGWTPTKSVMLVVWPNEASAVEWLEDPAHAHVTLLRLDETFKTAVTTAGTRGGDASKVDAVNVPHLRRAASAAVIIDTLVALAA
ncbi:hypothetical protein SPRG_17707 [Saprolegnia parasitica CBS 223.65]|uniref:Uncharacterized protein n=1 Tax=Saprolegnia parasitica (strain CBS 223.65) TaxID=695850 RepID=A0A067BFB3_SAPPC|nr:hypothetical protein SPRG_17707 [Saprolegnia parasitica CBS 223.65]KDO16808.1 hypothetical protein SPRG_17707 [Saprolegnia parasitica CBS 223.65]|eukprot:XP_012212484.1 hypothetical protein SPRG_17707 [Saprolegnia parasitica CBS 223.65]